MKSRNVLMIVLAFTALFATSCKEKTQETNTGTYKTVTIKPSTCELTMEYTATLQGRQNVEVRPQVSGTITKICVEEGARVRQGQTLFIIDQAPYKAALQKAIAEVSNARASVASARLKLQSKQQLRKQNVVSDYDVDQARNDLDEATASLATAMAEEALARNDLSYTVVKSPANGVIGMIAYRVGALVSSSITEPLTTVSDNSEVYAYFAISEGEMQKLIKDYGSLENAMKHMPRVKLRMSDGTDYSEEGRIDAVSGNVDEETGSVTLRAVFHNSKSLLRNGGSGTISMIYDYNNAIVIPQEATYELQDKVFCYRVVKGKAKSTAIDILSMNNGSQYVVLDGLHYGDVIVAEGAGLLHDGQEIKVKK